MISLNNLENDFEKPSQLFRRLSMLIHSNDILWLAQGADYGRCENYEEDIRKSLADWHHVLRFDMKLFDACFSSLYTNNWRHEPEPTPELDEILSRNRSALRLYSSSAFLVGLACKAPGIPLCGQPEEILRLHLLACTTLEQSDMLLVASFLDWLSRQTTKKMLDPSFVQLALVVVLCMIMNKSTILQNLPQSGPLRLDHTATLASGGWLASEAWHAIDGARWAELCRAVTNDSGTLALLQKFVARVG